MSLDTEIKKCYYEIFGLFGLSVFQHNEKNSHFSIRHFLLLIKKVFSDGFGEQRKLVVLEVDYRVISVMLKLGGLFRPFVLSQVRLAGKS